MQEAESPDTDVRDMSEERRAFLESRATIIGATDSPKILGLSRHGTALSVYEDKVNPVADSGEMSLPAWLGLKLQNTVAELYTARTGARVRADNQTHRMKEHPFIGCHLDFRLLGQPDILVECKTRAFQRGWGEDGTDKVPAEIWVQCQHEMLVTGAKRCDVAVLFGHHTFNVYPLPRNEEFLAALVKTLTEFYHDNWQAGVPPLPTGHPRDTEIVKEQNPDHDDEIKAATPEQAQFIQRLSMIRMNAAQAALAKSEAENRLRDMIGTAAGITGPFGTITWKRSKDTTEYGWENIAGSYRSILELIYSDSETVSLLRSFVDNTLRFVDLDAVQSIYTTVKPGTRRFHFDLVTEEEEDAVQG